MKLPETATNTTFNQQPAVSTPLLLDGTVSSYISHSLNKCHEQRVIHYFYLLNAGIVLLFGLGIGLFLYYSFQKKLSPAEKYNKMIRDKEHILNQIRVYQQEQHRLNSLTGLPFIEPRRGEQEMEFRR